MDDSDDETEYDENNAKKTAPPILRQDMSKGSYGYEGDTHTYTDATDGTVYVWDKEKNAWFPKVSTALILKIILNKMLPQDHCPGMLLSALLSCASLDTVVGLKFNKFI